MSARTALSTILSMILLGAPARPLGAEQDPLADGRTVLDDDSPIALNLAPLFDSTGLEDLDHIPTEEEDPHGFTRPGARLEGLDLEEELVAASQDPGAGLVGAAAEQLLYQTPVAREPLGALLKEVDGEAALQGLLDETGGETGLRATLGDADGEAVHGFLIEAPRMPHAKPLAEEQMDAQAQLDLEIAEQQAALQEVGDPQERSLVEHYLRTLQQERGVLQRRSPSP